MALLDLYIRYAAHITYFLIIWFLVASIVSWLRIPNSEKKRHQIMLVHGLTPVSMAILLMGSTFFGNPPTIYVPLGQVLIFNLVLVVVVLHFSAALLFPGRRQQHQRLLDVLLLYPRLLSSPVAQYHPSAPVERARYTIAAVVGLLALISYLGVALQPCGWLDRLTQYSGCLGTLADTNDLLFTDVVIAPDSSLLASANRGEMRLWDIPDRTMMQPLEHQDTIVDVAFLPDSTLLTYDSQQTVQQWNTANGTVIDTFTLSEHDIDDIEIASDGTLLAGSGESDITIWQWSDKARVAVLPGEARQVVFSPDGQWLVISRNDAQEIWRTRDWTMVHTLDPRSSEVAFSPDSKLLAGIGSSPNHIYVWQVATGQRLQTFNWPNDRGYSIRRPTAVAFLPDSTCVVVSNDDDTTRVWRVADGQIVEVLDQRNHYPRGGVDDLAIARDGTLATISWFGPIRLWNLQS